MIIYIQSKTNVMSKSTAGHRRFGFWIYKKLWNDF